MKKTRDERWAWWVGLFTLVPLIAVLALFDPCFLMIAVIAIPLYVVGFFRRVVLGRGKARRDPYAVDLDAQMAALRDD